MSTAKDNAIQILELMARWGWEVVPHPSIFKIQKRFQPGDMDALVQADGEYYSILSLMPQPQPGSVWGDDCGGIGAVSAVKNGLFKMNKSGVSKRVMSALQKLVAA